MLPGGVDILADTGQVVLVELSLMRAQLPEALRYPAAVRQMEEDLLRRLTKTIRVAPLSTARPASSLRQRGLDRALEYLRADPPTALTIPQLCKAARVSERTLEYAFRETFELTPLHFLRLQRLYAARRALAAADPHEAAVGHVAQRLGFYELGRFAGGYRRLFGELPSQTLRRPWPGSKHGRSTAVTLTKTRQSARIRASPGRAGCGRSGKSSLSDGMIPLVRVSDPQ
jgi:AraC-like DNA-binding protein